MYHSLGMKFIKEPESCNTLSLKNSPSPTKSERDYSKNQLLRTSIFKGIYLGIRLFVLPINK